MSIHVVAAIIKRDNEFLITRRASHKSLAGYWEFPGGKVDDGEKPEDALVREIKEELDVEVSVDSYYMRSEYSYDFGTVVLDSYFCQLVHAISDIASTDHDKVIWCNRDNLQGYDFAPADIPIIKGLHEDKRYA